MQIHIATPETVHTIDLNWNAGILDLKQLLAERTGLSIDEQCLMWRGEELHNFDKEGMVEFIKDGVIHLVQRQSQEQKMSQNAKPRQAVMIRNITTIGAEELKVALMG